jgi:hypothetical protein
MPYSIARQNRRVVLYIQNAQGFKFFEGCVDFSRRDKEAQRTQRWAGILRKQRYSNSLKGVLISLPNSTK